MQKKKLELPVFDDGDEVTMGTFPVLSDDEGDWVTLETAVEWEDEHRRLAVEAKTVGASVKRRPRTTPKH